MSGIPHVLNDSLDRLENQHWAKNTSVEAAGKESKLLNIVKSDCLYSFDAW